MIEHDGLMRDLAAAKTAAVRLRLAIDGLLSTLPEKTRQRLDAQAVHIGVIELEQLLLELMIETNQSQADDQAAAADDEPARIH